MAALPRALGALALTVAILLPASAAGAATSQDPVPNPSSGPSSQAGSSPGTGPSAEADTSARVSEPAAPILLKANSGDIAVPNLATRAWVLADLESGAILASQGADLAVRPASTLKLLTALTVTQRLSPEQPYRAIAADETAEGNRVVLHAGMTYQVADLLHAALLPSANDAAAALARANGGIDATVEQMNAEAARLGASHTTVKNPSGLDADGQQTTAYDMALIGRAAFANPDITSTLALHHVDFPGKDENGKAIRYPIYNHNRMLADKYPGVIGGKSGYTSLASRTFVGAAEQDGRRLMVTLFGIAGNTYTTGEKLLTWGFENAGNLQPVGQLTEPNAPAPVFDRSVTAVAKKGAGPTTRAAVSEGGVAADAPTGTSGASGWSLSLPSMPSLPSPLTILTLLMAVLAVLRARVYWIAHRHRTAWTELDSWARGQARSARRSAPAGRPERRPRATQVDVRGPARRGSSARNATARDTDSDLIGSPR